MNQTKLNEKSSWLILIRTQIDRKLGDNWVLNGQIVYLNLVPRCVGRQCKVQPPLQIFRPMKNTLEFNKWTHAEFPVNNSLTFWALVLMSMAFDCPFSFTQSLSMITYDDSIWCADVDVFIDDLAHWNGKKWHWTIEYYVLSQVFFSTQTQYRGVCCLVCGYGIWHTYMWISWSALLQINHYQRCLRFHTKKWPKQI